MDQQTATRATLLRREAMISIPLNATMSTVFFLVVFGWHPVDKTSLAFDFVPQTIGIAIVGTLVPSLLMIRRIKLGAVTPAGPVPSRRRHLGTLVLIAAGGAMVFGGGAALLVIALAPATLGSVAAVTIKALFGMGVGIVLTLFVLRSLLGLALVGPTAVRT